MVGMAPTPKRSREARTRGPDIDQPVNRKSTKVRRTKGAEQENIPAPLKRRRRVHEDRFPPERLAAIAKMAAGGMTNAEMAIACDTPLRTFNYWVAHSDELKAVLTAGKDEFDDRVVRTLAQKALGYEYVEQQAIKVKVGEDLEEVQIVDVERHVPADTTSIIFWLKNRQPHLWRDAKNIDIDGDVNVNVNQPTDRQVAMALISMLNEAAKTATTDETDEPLTIENTPTPTPTPASDDLSFKRKAKENT
jgi:hypothetical protein